MSIRTGCESRQASIEYSLGLKEEEYTFLNEQPDHPVAKAVRNLLWIQIQSYDPGGYAMLEKAVRDMRTYLANQSKEQ